MNTFYLNLEDIYFNKIKNHQKKIEMRLFSPKRQQIKVGDNIIFKNNLTNDELKTRVNNIFTFKSFKEMYDYFDKKDLGYLENEEASYLDMNKFYSNEDIDKYGVVGFEIEVL